MAKQKVTSIKEAVKTVELTNSELNLFMMHPGIKKLTESSGMKNKVKLRLYKFILEITDSEASKALQRMLGELNEKYKKDNPDGPPLMFDDSIFEDIFKQKSGVKIDLFRIRADELPTDITIQDMLMLKPFFDFKD